LFYHPPTTLKEIDVVKPEFLSDVYSYVTGPSGITHNLMVSRVELSKSNGINVTSLAASANKATV